MATNWEKHIKQQQRTKMSVADYCKAHKLNPPAFYHQRKLLRLKPQFSEVQVIDDIASPGFSLSINVDSNGDIKFHGSATDLGFMANLLQGR